MKWLKIRIGCMCQRCTCLRPYLATAIENNFMFFRIKEKKKTYLTKKKKMVYSKYLLVVFFKVILKNNCTNIENKKK